MARDFRDDFAIDPTTGALFTVDGDDALAQRLKKRLCTNEGEWAFDLGFGIPWLYEVLGRNIDSASTRTLIAETIEADPDVVSISELEAVTDRNLRCVTLRTTVQSTSGELVRIE